MDAKELIEEISTETFATARERTQHSPDRPPRLDYLLRLSSLEPPHMLGLSATVRLKHPTASSSLRSSVAGRHMHEDSILGRLCISNLVSYVSQCLASCPVL
jgi:hypothetical protein